MFEGLLDLLDGLSDSLFVDGVIKSDPPDLFRDEPLFDPGERRY